MTARDLRLLAVPVAVALAAAATAQEVPPVSERGALVRVVTRWTNACNESDRPAWDNMINNWYDEITDDRAIPYGQGGRAWWRDGFYENGHIVDSDFVDPDVEAWGRDFEDDHVDEADACLVGLHGGIRSGRWAGGVRENEPGTGNCLTWQGHMRFGDEDLEFLHLSSCDSLNRPTWPEWRDSFDGLHQVTGFHGTMYVVRAYGHRYGGVADDAFYMPLADAWIDNLYKYRSRGRNQCPVVMAMGAGYFDAWNRLDHERYDHVFDDPNHNYYAVGGWVAGCDPHGESPLP